MSYILLETNVNKVDWHVLSCVPETYVKIILYHKEGTVNKYFLNKSKLRKYLRIYIFGTYIYHE